MQSRMKIFTLLLGLFLTTQLVAQDNYAEAFDTEGWIIFVKSTPKTKHRNLGGVDASTMATTLKEEFLIKHMLKKAMKKYPEGQALIFTANLTHAEVITYNLSTKRSTSSRKKKGDEQELPAENRLCEVDDYQGTDVFVQCKPKTPYTELGEVEVDYTQKNYKVSYLIKTCSSMASEKYEDYDALIFVNGTNLFKAKVIKFN